MDLAARDVKNREFADNYYKESYTLKDFVYKQLGLAKKESNGQQSVGESKRSRHIFEQAVHLARKEVARRR